MRDLRAAFLEAVQGEDFACFKFVDETSTNLTYCRRYARAEGGQRAHQATPLHGGPNVTLVAALTPNGLQAAMTVSGAVNGPNGHFNKGKLLNGSGLQNAYTPSFGLLSKNPSSWNNLQLARLPMI